MLTLQLRAALQDVAAAEAQEAIADRDKVRDKLRAQLGPLLEDRRSGFEAELAQVRAEAAAAVAAAKRAAAALVAQEYSLVDRTAVSDVGSTPAAQDIVAAPVEALVEPLSEAPVDAPAVVDPPVLVAPVVAPLVIVPATEHIPVDEMLHWFDDDDDVAPPAAEIAPPVLSTLTGGDSSRAQLAMTNVAIDADAFAQAFAMAFGALLDERGTTWAVGVPGISVMPAPSGPQAPKPSFWTHARHPDVLLIGLATIIMLIVVAAWLA